MSTTESVILSNEPMHVHQTRHPAPDNAGSRLVCADRGVQRRPLIADPIADTHDGRNDGNQQDADQHSVFNQRRATLVGDKMFDEIRNSSHDPLRV